MTKRSRKAAETVTPEQAYESGVEVLRQRLRMVLGAREDALTLLAGGSFRWFKLVPFSELNDTDTEFWGIIANLLNDTGLGIDAIDTVLDVGAKSSQKARKEAQALLDKCGKGKGWEQ